MNIFLIIIVVFFTYSYVIKLSGVNMFISEISPYLGGIMNTLTYYTGADSAYNFLAGKGVYGEEKKQDEFERELVVLSNELDINSV